MRTLTAGFAATLAAITALVPSVASADDAKPTLADILLSDSAKDDAAGFDRRWWDYDIVTNALVLFPDLVEAASNPDAELTAFLPNDQAFRNLVREISGNWVRSEADVFAAVASLGTDTVKNVLLYHIVPSSISYRDARGADGVMLPTLLGPELEVDVKGRWLRYVELIDADINDANAIVISPNVGGQASNGYAHGITQVLRPIDLPLNELAEERPGVPTLRRMFADSATELSAVCVLGKVRINGPLGRAPLGGALPKGFLAVLASEAGRPVSIDRMADLLWGSEMPSGSRRGRLWTIGLPAMAVPR